MKFKLKKYLYLLNDVTDLLLKKDREKIESKYADLKKLSAYLFILLAVSLIANIVCIIILINTSR
jgi:hypothetical protein